MDVQMRKWTRLEYERLVECEILGHSRYGTMRALGPRERIAPLAVPGASVTVADLLP